MSQVEITDEGGDVFTGVKYKGKIYPNFDPEVIRNINNISIHDNDVILCAYPKSGTHWLWEMTRLVLAGHLDAPGLDKTVTMLERSPESGYKDLPSPRLLNTHVQISLLPPEVLEKAVKVIYITRNPKDVAVSYYNFFQKVKVPYKGKWNNFLKPYLEGKFAYESWFDYTRAWEEVKRTHKDLQILSLSYEGLKEDTLKELKLLTLFLGVERSEEYLQAVRDKCTFESMKAGVTSPHGAIAYRKGEVGDWKNWFTVAQNEAFDELYREKMKGCKLEFKYTLH